MVRGTIHDLVQWIVVLEQENFVLKQKVDKLQQQLDEKGEKAE